MERGNGGVHHGRHLARPVTQLVEGRCRDFVGKGAHVARGVAVGRDASRLLHNAVHHAQNAVSLRRGRNGGPISPCGGGEAAVAGRGLRVKPGSVGTAAGGPYGEQGARLGAITMNSGRLLSSRRNGRVPPFENGAERAADAVPCGLHLGSRGVPHEDGPGAPARPISLNRGMVSCGQRAHPPRGP